MSYQVATRITNCVHTIPLSKFVLQIRLYKRAHQTEIIVNFQKPGYILDPDLPGHKLSWKQNVF